MSSKTSLPKALREYFEIEGSALIKEFKALTPKDKDDFVAMFAEIGIEVERTAS